MTIRVIEKRPADPPPKRYRVRCECHALLEFIAADITGGHYIKCPECGNPCNMREAVKHP